MFAVNYNRNRWLVCSTWLQKQKNFHSNAWKILNNICEPEIIKFDRFIQGDTVYLIYAFAISLL